MSRYTSPSEANRDIAAQQTHNDMHRGHGVITMMTHRDIEKLAYDIYVKTGRKQGQCVQNWLKAEHDLRGKPPAVKLIPPMNEEGNDMLDHYGKEEVNQALDRLAADVEAKGHLTRQSESISAAREATTGQGSDWQEAERSPRNRTFQLDPGAENKE